MSTLSVKSGIQYIHTTYILDLIYTQFNCNISENYSVHAVQGNQSNHNQKCKYSLHGYYCYNSQSFLRACRAALEKDQFYKYIMALRPDQPFTSELQVCLLFTVKVLLLEFWKLKMSLKISLEMSSETPLILGTA